MGDIQVTLLIGFFMLISYIWAKIPYGMTAVFCCLALEITGVLSSAEAWAMHRFIDNSPYIIQSFP